MSNQLNHFIDKQLSQKALLGRNYFHCVGGKVKEFNKEYSFPDFKVTFKEYGKEIQKIRTSIAKILYAEDDDNKDIWVRCLPIEENDCEREAYLFIILSLDNENKLSNIDSYIYMEEMLCANYYFTDEVSNEMDKLCSGIYLPDQYSLKGQKVTEGLKAQMHLNCAGCDYMFQRLSGFRSVVTSFFLDVDENDIITNISYQTDANTMFWSRPVSDEDSYQDVFDALIAMHDSL